MNWLSDPSTYSRQTGQHMIPVRNQLNPFKTHFQSEFEALFGRKSLVRSRRAFGRLLRQIPQLTYYFHEREEFCRFRSSEISIWLDMNHVYDRFIMNSDYCHSDPFLEYDYYEIDFGRAAEAQASYFTRSVEETVEVYLWIVQTSMRQTRANC